MRTEGLTIIRRMQLAATSGLIRAKIIALMRGGVIAIIIAIVPNSHQLDSRSSG